jgi:hypothetical protein
VWLQVDKYDTQSAIALLRQHVDYGHWYDRQKLTAKTIQNCQYIAAMNPSAGSFLINPRLQVRGGAVCHRFMASGCSACLSVFVCVCVRAPMSRCVGVLSVCWRMCPFPLSPATLCSGTS